MPPTDATTTLQRVKDAIAQFTAARDWQKFHSLKNLAMAIASESGELMAHFRWSGDEAEPLRADAVSFEQVRLELADVLLLLAEFANVAGIDMAQAVFAKMELNAERYPVEKARGTAAKYDRL